MIYVNVHTSTHPGGEIRGQVVPLRIPVVLSGAAEVPAVATGGVGSGSIILIGKQMTYEIHYSGLSADATAARLHGPADAAHPANVLFGLEGAAGTSGARCT